MKVALSTLRTAPALAALMVISAVCANRSHSTFAASGLAPTQHSSRSRVPDLYEARRQVEEYIRSGRYERDAAKVVDSARAWLDKRVKTAVKPAIVLDIDETALSNWPAIRINSWTRIVNGPCDLEHGPCGIRAWQAMGQSKAIAPTLAFARHARQLGVAVFFITGRPARLLEATERNLKEEGYDWTEVILEPDNEKFASVADFKGPQRRKIEEQGYTIILNLGDQESDLEGGYAERTFKLPNPVYYIP